MVIAANMPNLERSGNGPENIRISGFVRLLGGYCTDPNLTLIGVGRVLAQDELDAASEWASEWAEPESVARDRRALAAKTLAVLWATARKP